jgi:hypothetical protein
MVRCIFVLRSFVAPASIVAACVAVAMSGFATSARAEASFADKAAAQTLFDEGRKLMAEGKLDKACPKLAESQKLDPGVGTQFQLADCHERLGQTASAWAGFLEVASAARALGQSDREKVARERAAALSTRLSKLTIVSPQAEALPGLEIKRDGAVVGRALWGSAIPVDPGTHVIEAAAPGKKPWQSATQIAGEHASVVVTIPALDDAPAKTQAAREPGGSSLAVTSDDTGAPGKSRRTLGLIVGGVGIVGLGIGTTFAVIAKSKYNDSLASCSPDNKNRCNDQGVSLRDDARSAGNVATVAFGVGGAALVAGAVLFFTAPSTPEKPHIAVAPAATPGSASLVVLGTY